MKNAFYLMLKALFVLEIFTFFSWLYGYVVKPLDKQTKVDLKIYKFTDWNTNIAITILPNISISKGNQTIKLANLIKHDMRNLFLEKSHLQNVVEKLVPDPFTKMKNSTYLWIISLTFYKVCFYCYVQVVTYQLF